MKLNLNNSIISYHRSNGTIEKHTSLSSFWWLVSRTFVLSPFSFAIKFSHRQSIWIILVWSMIRQFQETNFSKYIINQFQIRTYHGQGKGPPRLWGEEHPRSREWRYDSISRNLCWSLFASFRMVGKFCVWGEPDDDIVENAGRSRSSVRRVLKGVKILPPKKRGQVSVLTATLRLYPRGVRGERLI